ncbi:uracil-DNA glycosylase [Brackiella oedipodis]|uniref:uracil-DNA glycosylase n=1 Tax=Brackiella oedipodis TaxID=124225 RepID=UPI0004906403|nr:uracil-DNA glycosylase [Brackiella oedipodis]
MKKLPLSALQLLWLEEHNIPALWSMQWSDLAPAQNTELANTSTPASRAHGATVAPSSHPVAARAGLSAASPTPSSTPAATSSAASASAKAATVPPPRQSTHAAGDIKRKKDPRQALSAPENSVQALTVAQELPDFTQMSWQQLTDYVQTCQACSLGAERDQPVFSNALAGAPETCRFMFVVENPSGQDDSAGVPLSGKVGELFKNILFALNMKAQEVMITPLVKCHSFTTAIQEPSFAACLPVFKEQLERCRPEVIIAFGNVAGRLLELQGNLSDWRQQRLTYESPNGWQAPVIATHHPQYLLLNQAYKAQTWQDLRHLRQA